MIYIYIQLSVFQIVVQHNKALTSLKHEIDKQTNKTNKKHKNHTKTRPREI